MMKKGKRLSSVSRPSSSSFPNGEDAKARIKLQILLQDYDELLKDTEAKKLRLQRAREAKPKLSAEVRFLRRKYKQFMKNPSQGTQYRLKKQLRKILPQSPGTAGRQREAPLRDSYQRARETGNPSISVMLDLNQTFLPNGEDMEELHVAAEQSKRFGPEDAASDPKLSICRGLGSSGNRVGKRRITWQDQVALRI